MASVMFGGGVTAMRGQLGGVVFSVWKGIGTARRRTNPVRRMRTAQPQRRSVLGWLSRKWGTISQANRDLWQIWADEHPGTDKFGNPFIMSGMNQFIKLNTMCFMMGGVALVQDAPPPLNLTETIVDFVATQGVNPGEIDLDWTLPGGGAAADYIEILQAGPLASPALTKLPREMDFEKTVAGNIVTTTLTGLVETTTYWFAGRYVGVDGQTAAYSVDSQIPTPTP